MAEKKTGLEKFMTKQFPGGVKIGEPANNVEREIPSREETVSSVQEEVKKNKGGRPPKKDKPEQATIMLNVDRELKRKLEEVKYLTHKSTLKDVLIEAMNDILKKYEID